jgi:hypothetical protein
LGISVFDIELLGHSVSFDIHQRRKMKCDLADTLNSTWKNDKSAFGFRMLKKMGWKEDTGLGKNEDGRVDNVKLKIRDNCVGLGSEEVTDTSGNNHWGSSVESFENVLSLLKESYGTTTIKSKNKSKTVAKAKKNASYSVGIK